MNGARHLGGNGSQRLALEIGVVAILGDVALVFEPLSIRSSNYLFQVWAWFEGSSYGCELFMDTFDRGLGQSG
jgi:hypothetical protein